jgi:ribonuclease BN (tRNA processing enzyme)
MHKDANVTVTAFATKHAMASYGYRFDTADRSTVITGDTNPTQASIDASHGGPISRPTQRSSIRRPRN